MPNLISKSGVSLCLLMATFVLLGYVHCWAEPETDREVAIAKIPDERLKTFATEAAKISLTLSPDGLDLAKEAADYFRSDTLIRLQDLVNKELPDIKIKSLHMTPTIDDSKVLFTNNDHFVGVSGSCRMQGSYEGGNIDLITGFNVIYSIVPVPVSGPLDPLTCKFQVADFKIHLDATPADASVIPNEVIELGKRAVLIALNQSSLGIDDMESAKKVFRPYALGRTQGKIAPIFPDLANLECVVSARQIDHSIQEDGIYYFSEDGTCLITGTKDGQHVKQIIPFRILFSIIKNPEAGGEPYLIADVKFRIDVASKGFPGRD